MNFEIALNREQMIMVERAAVKSGLTYSRLMENAGSAAARFIRTKYKVYAKNVAIICGNGNNGGDGFVIARKLHDEGANVTIILACSYPKTREATERFEQIKHFEIDVINYETDALVALEQMKKAFLLVDCAYGIGFRDEFPQALHPLFEAINIHPADVVAIDIPSGMDCDTGNFDPRTPRCRYTITFTALKQAFTVISDDISKEICGDIEVVKIGIDDEIVLMNSDVGIPLISNMIKPMFSARQPNTHKGDYGNLLTICGSMGMMGAASMAIMAALRSGVGLVTAVVSDKMYPIIATNLWEPVYHIYSEETENGSSAYDEIPVNARGEIIRKSHEASAVLIGCGFGVNENKINFVNSIVRKRNKPTVVDADGLTCLATQFSFFDDNNIGQNGINFLKGHINILETSNDAPLILTPHPGEMARLTGLSVDEIQQNRVKIARAFVALHNVILVLKGNETVIAAPGKPTLINKTGNPGMATGGSGDILAGMIASFCAQGMDAHDAACSAVFLHGLAADKAAEQISQHSLLPKDILKELGKLFLILEK